MIAYSSRKLKVHRMNYLIHHHNLAAIEFAFKIWRYYIYGVHVDVFTNQKSLKFVFTQKDWNLPQTRWLDILLDYDMSVLYYLGKINVVSNALRCMSTGSVAYVKYKKELVCDVHRFSQ